MPDSPNPQSPRKGPQKKTARLAAAQAKTVMRQWTGVIAESLGAKPATVQLPAPAVEFNEEKWKAAGMGASWLGHATTLLRIGGLTVLTDPHLDDRAGVRLGNRKIGRRRAVAVPVAAEALPPVDLLLLSHAHMDHWDIESLLRLSRTPWAGRASVVIPTGTRRLLPPGFGRVIELPWEKTVEIESAESNGGAAGGVTVGAIRPRHWGARFLFDRKRGYNAYTLDSASQRIVFGGDTAMTDAFDFLGQDSSRAVELAVMGIGSYEPWEDSHATPEQVAEMAGRMGARLLMPIHHATFYDSNIGLDEPLERLRKVWEAERMVCSRVGDVWLGGV